MVKANMRCSFWWEAIGSSHSLTFEINSSPALSLWPLYLRIDGLPALRLTSRIHENWLSLYSVSERLRSLCFFISPPGALPVIINMLSGQVAFASIFGIRAVTLWSYIFIFGRVALQNKSNCIKYMYFEKHLLVTYRHVLILVNANSIILKKDSMLTSVLLCAPSSDLELLWDFWMCFVPAIIVRCALWLLLQI